MMSLRAVETHTDVHRTVENFGNDCEGDVGDALHSLDGHAAATRRHLDQPRDRDDPKKFRKHGRRNARTQAFGLWDISARQFYVFCVLELLAFIFSVAHLGPAP